MIELPIFPILTELGLKPTEVIILAMLWQNVKSTKALLDKLVCEVGKLEKRVNEVQKGYVA